MKKNWQYNDSVKYVGKLNAEVDMQGGGQKRCLLMGKSVEGAWDDEGRQR